MIKYLTFSCIAAFVLFSFAGCASDEKQSSTSETSTATMTPDSKDMTHRNSNSSH